MKQDEIDWDIAKLMVNSIYRISSQSCDQTNNKLLSETGWNWMRHCQIDGNLYISPHVTMSYGVICLYLNLIKLVSELSSKFWSKCILKVKFLYMEYLI